jgi:hypothetical protein
MCINYDLLRAMRITRGGQNEEGRRKYNRDLLDKRNRKKL